MVPMAVASPIRRAFPKRRNWHETCFPSMHKLGNQEEKTLRMREAQNPSTEPTDGLYLTGLVGNDLQTPASCRPSQTVLGLFHEAALQHLDAIALTEAGTSISYGQLWHWADAFRKRLAKNGVCPGDLVGVAANRSMATIAAILGIMMAGGCYVPVDLAEFPASVLLPLVERTGLRHWITDVYARGPENPMPWNPRFAILLEEVPCPAAGPLAGPVIDTTSVAINPDSPLYVMFTSGSTGLPKAVVVPHRAVVRLVVEQNFLKFGPEQTFLLHSPLSFDASTLELWGGLLHGGRVAIAPARLGLEEYSQIVAQQRITTLWMTAAIFHLAAEHAPEMFAPLSQLLFGGDVVSPKHVERVRHLYPELHMVNGYGPTENTTFTCCYVVPADYRADGNLPIGRAIAHTNVYVLDEQYRAVPQGEEGQLAAGGEGVALGFLGQPELTSERFISDPFSSKPGARLYLTGDRARQRPDGILEFLGRMDRQVKIAGHRIELALVESELSKSPLAMEAAVVVVTPSNGEKQLWGCVAMPNINKVSHPQAEQILRSWLARRLPRAAVPQQFLLLEKLPINTNGKLDRRALQTLCESRNLPAGSSAAVAAEELTSGNALKYVQALWAGLLGKAGISADDNFFDLGGTSLLLIEMHAQLKSRFADAPSVVDLFGHSTPRRLAEQLSPSRKLAGEMRVKASAAGIRGERQRTAMAGRRAAAIRTLEITQECIGTEPEESVR